jgi:fused signal recognition particle receptor
MLWIYLALIAVVLVFGLGVVLVGRRRSGGELALDDRTSEIVRPPRPVGQSPVRPSPGRPAPTAQEPGDEAAASEPDEPVVDRPSLASRMGRARSALTGAFLGIRSRGGITDDTWNDLEEALLRADVGIKVTNDLLGDLRARVKAKQITDADGLLDALRADMTARLEGADRDLHFVPGEPGSPNVWLFVGVNGVGKTTTIGKVSALQKAEGRTVLMAAGDTFRAAAA